MLQAVVTTKVTEALSCCGYLTRNGLARSIGCSPCQIVDALDAIEAAGIKLQRTRGPGGGAAIAGGKRVWKAA